jgi:hypothetical protein
MTGGEKRSPHRWRARAPIRPLGAAPLAHYNKINALHSVHVAIGRCRSNRKGAGEGERSFLPLARGKADALSALRPDCELDQAEFNFRLGVLACAVAVRIGSAHPLVDLVSEARHERTLRDRAVLAALKAGAGEVIP